MNNRLEQLLQQWRPDKDAFDWVLATVIETAGSSYRKSGAIMLINEMGQYFGLLSGGCLESDIMRQAKQVMATGLQKVICYDMREEDDLGWQLGIGCGGMVKILLQKIDIESNYLHLEQLADHLDNRITCYYQQNANGEKADNQLSVQPFAHSNSHIQHVFKPRPFFAVFGGGVDAQPVIKIANVLGWKTLLVDERVNYARAVYFKGADLIVREKCEELQHLPVLEQIDAAVIMSHNVALDAKYLQVMQGRPCKYLGLLGPKHRTTKVLNAAGLNYSMLTRPLANPVGFDIGGELPESIALSIMAEAHACLEGKNGAALTQVLQHVS